MQNLWDYLFISFFLMNKYTKLICQLLLKSDFNFNEKEIRKI